MQVAHIFLQQKIDRLDMIALLLKHDADIDVFNSDAKTLLDYAEQSKWNEIIQLFSKAS